MHIDQWTAPVDRTLGNRIFRFLDSLVVPVFFNTPCAAKPGDTPFVWKNTMLTLEQDGIRLLREGERCIPLRDFGDCRNQYSGRVFLLASGRSAADFPVADYAQFPFVAMNGSIQRLVEEGVKPLFYLCDDGNFVAARPNLAALGARHSQYLAMNLGCLLALHESDPGILPGRRIYLLERVNRYYGKKPLSNRRFAWSIRKDPELASDFSMFRQKPNRIGFSRNLQKGYFGARTIVYAATQLAYHLGFREVFIIGMDLRTSVGRFYEQEQQKALPTSLDMDFDGFIQPSFRFMAEKIIAQEDFRVFNLSPISRLPASILPKIDLEALRQQFS
jgi:KDO transferase-3